MRITHSVAILSEAMLADGVCSGYLTLPQRMRKHGRETKAEYKHMHPTRHSAVGSLTRKACNRQQAEARRATRKEARRAEAAVRQEARKEAQTRRAARKQLATAREQAAEAAKYFRANGHRHAAARERMRE